MAKATRFTHGVHHAGSIVPDLEWPTRHMMFYMPGGIRLELIARAACLANHGVPHPFSRHLPIFKQ